MQNVVLFMETFTEQIIKGSKRTFVLGGTPLDAADVASSRGMLPVFLNITRVQSAACAKILPENMHHILFGWLKAFATVPDQDTLTGCRVICSPLPSDGEVLRYAMGAAFVVAVDFMIANSESPTINLDPFTKEFSHAGFDEGMRLDL